MCVCVLLGGEVHCIDPFPSMVKEKEGMIPLFYDLVVYSQPRSLAAVFHLKGVLLLWGLKMFPSLQLVILAPKPSWSLGIAPFLTSPLPVSVPRHLGLSRETEPPGGAGGCSCIR